MSGDVFKPLPLNKEPLMDREIRVSTPDESLRREDILWAYRILLGREPESEAAIQEALSYKSRRDLLDAFLKSSEFQSRNWIERQYFPLISPPIEIESEAEPEAMRIIIQRVSDIWRSLGETKPHWSVLSSDEFLPDNIAATERKFYDSGAYDLNLILSTLRRIGRASTDFHTVYEYGCGIGRVTRHLAARFPKVVACDISTSHLQLARQATGHRGGTNIRFVQATPPDFGMTEPFDLWFSRIVLQHNTPPLIRLILSRALQKLRPGGLAIFQVPTYAPGYRFAVADYIANLGQSSDFEMHVIPQNVVFAIAKQAGCSIIEVLEDDAAGSPSWLSNSFVIQK